MIWQTLQPLLWPILSTLLGVLAYKLQSRIGVKTAQQMADVQAGQTPIQVGHNATITISAIGTAGGGGANNTDGSNGGNTTITWTDLGGNSRSLTARGGPYGRTPPAAQIGGDGGYPRWDIAYSTYASKGVSLGVGNEGGEFANSRHYWASGGAGGCNTPARTGSAGGGVNGGVGNFYGGGGGGNGIGLGSGGDGGTGGAGSFATGYCNGGGGGGAGAGGNGSAGLVIFSWVGIP
jgi:hypothetical protein